MTSRQSRIAVLHCLLASALLVQECPALAGNADETAQETGGDITRPTHRIDLRVGFESSDEERSRNLTLRYTHPAFLTESWRLNLQIDLPFASVKHHQDSPENDTQARGDGDVILQALFAHELPNQQGVGFGTQLIIPTASEKASGKGKWRLRPMVGYRWSVPRLSEGSFFQLLLRYDFSFAGDDKRAGVSELQFGPSLEIALPRSMYLSFFPSPDIRYNFKTDEIFVPLNVEVGKSFGRRLIVSFEFGKSLIEGNEPPYRWKAEGRVGFRF